MSWLGWVGLAVFVTVLAALTGVKPKGTRPIAHSRMMGVARAILLILLVIFAVMAYRARAGH
jgi:hypothetical protein